MQGCGSQGAHVPLSRSTLYGWQAEYYSAGGADTWSSGAVPSWITSNAAVAQRNASVILAAWLDLQRRGCLGNSGPLVVLELGAGSGQFAFALLTALLPRTAAVLGDAVCSRIRYIMTDAARSIVDSWMRHPQLLELAEAGVLDFAVLEAACPGWGRRGIPLEFSKRVFTPPSFEGASSCIDVSSTIPVIAIANYVFDSMPVDVWQVLQLENGQRLLRRGLVSIEADCVPSSVATVDSFARVRRLMAGFKATWEFEQVASMRASSPGCQCDAACIVRHYGEEDTTSTVAGSGVGALLDRLLDWYLAHGCARGLHEAFACDWGAGSDLGRSAARPSSLESLLARLNANSETAQMQSKLLRLVSCPLSGRSFEIIRESAVEPPSLHLEAPCGSEASEAEPLDVSCTSCTFSLPVGALVCISELLLFTTGSDATRSALATPSCTGGGFILLVADKGLLDPSCFAGAGLPDVHRHGSISTMLNFHALALWASLAAGHAGASAVSLDDDVNIKTAIFAFVPEALESAAPAAVAVGRRFATLCAAWPQALDAWTRELVLFGPADLHDLVSTVSRDAPPAPGRRYHVRNADTLGGFDLAVCSDSEEEREGDDDGAPATCGGNEPGRSDVGEMRRDALAEAAASLSSAKHAAASVPSMRLAATGAAPSPPPCPMHDGAGCEEAADEEEASQSRVSLRGAVALCRLAAWDGDAVHAFRGLIAARLAPLSPPRRLSLWRGLQACARAFFWPPPPLPLLPDAGPGVPAGASPLASADVDVLFDIARVLHLAGQRAAAQQWYLASLRCVDPACPAVAFNLGLCCAGTSGQGRLAAGWFGQALRWSGGKHVAARAWLRRANSCGSDGDCADSDEDGSGAAAGNDGRVVTVPVSVSPSFGRVRMFV